MPCKSDYLDASNREKELSKVLALLDELDGKPLPKNYGSGYDERAYSKATQQLLDKKTAELCSKLKKLTTPAARLRAPITQYSLEMQIWWRDHQKADKERNKKMLQQLKRNKLQQQALAKLSPEERKALNI